MIDCSVFQSIIDILCGVGMKTYNELINVVMTVDAGTMHLGILLRKYLMYPGYQMARDVEFS